MYRVIEKLLDQLKFEMLEDKTYSDYIHLLSIY